MACATSHFYLYVCCVNSNTYACIYIIMTLSAMLHSHKLTKLIHNITDNHGDLPLNLLATRSYVHYFVQIKERMLLNNHGVLCWQVVSLM
jgi:hypothetical protein